MQSHYRARAWRLRWLWRDFDGLLGSADRLCREVSRDRPELAVDCQHRLTVVKDLYLDLTAASLTPELDEPTFQAALQRFEDAWRSLQEIAAPGQRAGRARVSARVSGAHGHRRLTIE